MSPHPTTGVSPGDRPSRPNVRGFAGPCRSHKGVQFAQVPRWIQDHPKLNAGDRDTFATLALHINTSRECWPSVARLAKLDRVSRATVFRRLARLEEAGAITRSERLRPNGSQTSTLYRLAWSRRLRATRARRINETPRPRPSKNTKPPLPPTISAAEAAVSEEKGAAPPSDPPPKSQPKENQKSPPKQRQNRHSPRAEGTNPRALAKQEKEQAEFIKRRQEQLVAAGIYGKRIARLGLVPPEEFPAMVLDAAAKAGWPPDVTAVALDAFEAVGGARAG